MTEIQVQDGKCCMSNQCKNVNSQYCIRVNELIVSGNLKSFNCVCYSKRRKIINEKNNK